MRHYHQISDDIAAKIIESNPIVSIATLKPALSLSHKLENGVGTYTVAATYQYQLHTLNMPALLAAHQRNQRFAQQQSIWFEWPDNSAGLANTIQQQLAVRVLRSEEVMGFDTQQTVLLQNRLTISTIQPIGATPAERGQSVFEQLRDHGVPGGIIGEPQGILLAACEMLWRNNRQARILWLVPSSAKGRVTRAINNSDIKSYVTVASLVTLRDEVALFSHSWTLVVFQALDQLLDGSPQARRLAQLKWDWAFLSITSKSGLSRSLMSVLHIPEQYYEQFCARYLFDLKSNAPHPQPNPVAPPKVTPLPSQPYPRVPAQKPALESIRSKPTSSPIYRTIKLNQHKIVKLHEES
ncbi:MAG: hypothetical protein ACRDHZ_26255, partial [Ktedonobacteraceae bacterium]